MSAYPVDLTQRETFFLSDALSMNGQGPMPDSRPYPELLLKIGAAFLDLSDQVVVVTVHFTADELWMIREVAKTGVQVGQERVGLNLLRKIYPGLRALSAEGNVHSAVTQIGETTGIDEPDTHSEVKRKLEEAGYGPEEKKES